MGQANHVLTQLEMPSHTHLQATGSISGTIKIGANTEAGTSSEAADQTFGHVRFLVEILRVS